MVLGMSGYVIQTFLEKNGRTICKQRRPRAGSALFANYPFWGLQTKMGLKNTIGDTKEMQHSRSTAFLRHQKKKR